MLIDNMLAYAEVDEILNLLEEEYANKIPEKIRKFLKEEKMPDYKPEIKVDIPLTEQNLKRETMVLLAILTLNYWCESEEEKDKFRKELAENEKEKKALEEKYNPENLFKNKQHNKLDVTNKEDTENVALIEYKKPSLLKKILEKITRFFKRK